MTSLASICARGFRPSITGGDDSSQWGARTLNEGTRKQSNGVYTVTHEEVTWDKQVGNGYSFWCDIFGDWAYFCVYYVLYANYEARVAHGRKNKQLVFPAEHVFIKEIRICVRPYHAIPRESTVMPVWLPVLEVPFKTCVSNRVERTVAKKPSVKKHGTVAAEPDINR